MSFRGRTAQHLVWLLISMAALGVLVLPAARVAADQNPPGCTQNNLALDIGRDTRCPTYGNAAHSINVGALPRQLERSAQIGAGYKSD